MNKDLIRKIYNSIMSGKLLDIKRPIIDKVLETKESDDEDINAKLKIIKEFYGR